MTRATIIAGAFVAAIGFGVAAKPAKAQCYYYAPPVYAAPAPVFVPPPVYYYPAPRVYVPSYRYYGHAHYYRPYYRHHRGGAVNFGFRW